MWNHTEYTNKPTEIDNTSSSTSVYIRKNISFVEATEERDAHWECDEQIIPKSDWVLYEKLLHHDSEISDVEDAIIELAELIGG